MSFADFFAEFLTGTIWSSSPCNTNAGNIDLLEVLSEVGLGECLDRFIRVLQPCLHAPKPELIQRALGDCCAGPVSAIELNCQVLVELGTILE